ncbi:MAG: hypothetical protein AAFX06_33150 [Planctomycetota bacterium]
MSERILKRAEAIERARKKQTATSTRTRKRVTATARWKAAVAKCIDSGMPRAKAIRWVDSDNPGLRAKMLAEVNAKPTGNPVVKRTAKQDFDDEVARFKAERNMSHRDAVKAVIKDNPELHKAYIDEANQRGNR